MNYWWRSSFFELYLSLLLTRLPRIWLIAADSLSVHSATIFGLISFMYSMKAFRGFLICVRFLSSLSRSRAALRLATEVVVVITDDGEMSTEHVLSECGEKLPEVDPGERRPPGPHLDKGLKNRKKFIPLPMLFKYRVFPIVSIYPWCKLWP